MAVLVATSQKDMGDSIGIGERTFATWLSEGCPGNPREYSFREVIEWAKANKWNQTQNQSSLDDDDLIKTIGEGDLRDELVRERIENLKRDRQLKDFKIEERDSLLVDVSVIENFLKTFSELVNNGIETIEKKYGPDSCNPVRKSIERMQRELNGGAFDISSSN